MKKAKRVTNVAEAEWVIIRFLKDLMTQESPGAVRAVPGPYDWVETYFRGRWVRVNCNGKITIGCYDAPRDVCMSVGNEFRSWMLERARDHRRAADRAARFAHAQKVLSLANELLVAR